MKKFFAVFLIIMMMATFTGCTQSIEKDIIGIWVATETEDAVMLEFTDKTYTFVGISGTDLSGDTFEGTYKIDEEKKVIILEYDGVDKIKLNYSYDEDKELYLELYDVKFIKGKK